MVNGLKNITIRVEDDMYKEIEELTNLEKSDKSTVARQLLARGLREYRKKRALELYRDGKCTLWKAAHIAEIPLREIIELVKIEKIPAHFSVKDVDQAWSRVFGEQ